MHHTRLVGGLISLAALLTLLLVPGTLLAASAPSPASSGTPDPIAVRRRPWTPCLFLAPPPHDAAADPAPAQVMRIARELRGIPYVYGGASRSGFDCSGFTMYVYKRVGFSLSHGATDQARRGARVSLRHLKPGDLVFYGGSGYYGHVAIYAGRGRSSTRRTPARW